LDDDGWVAPQPRLGAARLTVWTLDDTPTQALHLEEDHPAAPVRVQQPRPIVTVWSLDDVPAAPAATAPDEGEAPRHEPNRAAQRAVARLPWADHSDEIERAHAAAGETDGWVPPLPVTSAAKTLPQWLPDDAPAPAAVLADDAWQAPQRGAQPPSLLARQHNDELPAATRPAEDEGWRASVAPPRAPVLGATWGHQDEVVTPPQPLFSDQDYWHPLVALQRPPTVTTFDEASELIEPGAAPAVNTGNQAFIFTTTPRASVSSAPGLAFVAADAHGASVLVEPGAAAAPQPLASAAFVVTSTAQAFVLVEPEQAPVPPA
jgi:hypothetical protein